MKQMKHLHFATHAELARLAAIALAQPLTMTHKPRPEWHFAPELIAEVEQRKERVGTYR